MELVNQYNEFQSEADNLEDIRKAIIFELIDHLNNNREYCYDNMDSLALDLDTVKFTNDIKILDEFIKDFGWKYVYRKV